ncbi:hypothetical protein CDV36_002021 [Fusarium kuroshium]|uniref:Uncharacterized protein n=2 Tax=Fusarium solani species complex TaxID=232080 RepID=A0A3M2SM57_9HYPO|nr:hypothetical protein CDV36_002021 [Fusarium kuroshium]RSL57457.1 hypothetical protein CEP51_014236 [Fusarium floridanum]
MTSNPTPTDKGHVSGEDVLPVSDSPMMICFIYDTSSFSDILVQLTIVNSTIEPAPEEGDEHVTERTDDDTNNKGKDGKSGGN